MRFLLFIIFNAFAFAVAMCQISVSPAISFRDAVWSNKYGSKEDVSGDAGGYICFLVQNLSGTSDTIENISFTGGGTQYEPEAYYWWPHSMKPGNFNASFVYVKGTKFPFRENDAVTIDITTTNGHTVSFTSINKTPDVAIANVLQVKEDKRSFRIYLRNDAGLPVSIDSIRLNSIIITPGDSINAGNIGIYYITLDQDAVACDPLWVEVHGSLRDGSPVRNSAGIRVVAPEFPIGTWHSGGLNPENENGRKNLKELGISSLHGPGNPGLMQNGWQEYGLRTIYEPGFGDPLDTALAGARVREWADKDFIHHWTIDDEPDLNGKDIPEQVLKNLTYWNNDPNTPSYVNLAVQKKYNRYGWYADIVGMDHYAAPPAPNIIALTWVPVVGRAGELEEALDYTEQLKFNVEPRRMWTWCQLAPGPWDYAQDDFALNIQFWMHIMGGAKGIEWFVAQSHTKGDHPVLWAESKKVIRQLNPVKNLCFYGERADIVSSSTNKVKTRALVGPDAVVIPVANNTVKYTWNGSFDPIKYIATIQSVSYNIEFELPEWIDPQQAYAVTAEGRKSAVTLQPLGGRKYRISPTTNLYKESHVYVIGAQDHTAPLAPTGLNVPDSTGETQYTLSWNEPHDNFGVHGYLVFYNNRFIDTAWISLYEVNSDLARCANGVWSVQAFDASGNVGPAATVSKSYGGDTIAPAILSTPDPVMVINAGQDTVLQIVATGLELAYQWQISADLTNWSNIIDDVTFSGSTSASLIINDPAVELDALYIRCNIIDLCGNELVSDVVQLDINAPTGLISHIRDLNIYPNPAGKWVYISTTGTALNDKVEIIDKSGRILLSKESENIIDIQSLPAGMYIIKAYAKKGVFSSTFVKQ